jgi:hypothetical protein
MQDLFKISGDANQGCELILQHLVRAYAQQLSPAWIGGQGIVP